MSRQLIAHITAFPATHPPSRGRCGWFSRQPSPECGARMLVNWKSPHVELFTRVGKKKALVSSLFCFLGQLKGFFLKHGSGQANVLTCNKSVQTLYFTCFSINMLLICKPVTIYHASLPEFQFSAGCNHQGQNMLQLLFSYIS